MPKHAPVTDAVCCCILRLRLCVPVSLSAPAAAASRWSVWFSVRLPSCQSDARSRQGTKGSEREGSAFLKSQRDATVVHIVTSNNSRSLCFSSSIVTAQHSVDALKCLKINVFHSEVLFLITQVLYKHESSMIV